MPKFIEKLVQNIKKTLTFQNSKLRKAFLVFTAIIVSQLTLPADLLASGPKFNFLAGDFELLRGANASQNETKWHDPVSAKAGDSVAVIAYYHNGVEKTTAKNTTIRVELPTNTAKTLVLKGHLKADNASSEVKDNFTINAAQSSTVEYIPGTTQWYANGSQTPQTLADGITSSKGINIGDVNGCWQFAGYVVFQVQVKIPGQPNISIDKTVSNSTTQSGTHNWVKENTAKAGETLAYKLYFKNSGLATAENVKISDTLPNYVSYVAGSTNLYTNKTGTAGTKLADSITGSGIDLGDLKTGNENSGFVVFQVKITKSLTPGSYTLINKAKITSSNAGSKEDSAKTKVTIVMPGQVNDTITKLVRNVSQNQSEFVDSNSALAGQTLEYKISFTITGDINAKQVRISDVLPNVAGAPVHFVANSAKLNIAGHESQLSNSIVSTGVNLGDLAPGTSGVITFRVTVDNNPSVGEFNLINTAKISADNIAQKQDTASTHIIVTPPARPFVNIEKTVRNLTLNESIWQKANFANPGDTLQYHLQYNNTGEGIAHGVIISDVLPAGVTYVPGSTILVFNGQTYTLVDGIIGSGISVPDLAPGQSGYITFKVVTSKKLTNGTVLTNIGKIQTSEGARHQSEAKTTIKVVAPITPVQPQILSAKVLPPTGGMATLALVLSSVIIGIYYYLKNRKELYKAYLESRMI